MAALYASWCLTLMLITLWSWFPPLGRVHQQYKIFSPLSSSSTTSDDSSSLPLTQRLWAWCTHTQKCHQTFNSQPFDLTAELIVRIRFSLTWKRKDFLTKKFWDCLVYVCSPFKVMRSHLGGQPTIFPQSSASHPFCRQPLPRIKSYLPSAVQGHPCVVEKET